jgi:hypothetical protein
MWVYRKNEAYIVETGKPYEVGFYVSTITVYSNWHYRESYESQEEAARRVNYLNGGNGDKFIFGS